MFIEFLKKDLDYTRILYGDEVIPYIECKPYMISEVDIPTIKAQRAAYFNADRVIKYHMVKNPAHYQMEEFFEKNPHIVLASEMGLLE